MTRVKTLTRVLDILLESSLSPAKNAKRLESDSDESLTRPNTNSKLKVEKVTSLRHSLSLVRFFVFFSTPLFKCNVARKF
jgi:hypothetical protein